MDSKQNNNEDVKSVLIRLHQKIDSLKEKVEQLCETTSHLHTTPVKAILKRKEKRKQD
jgi:hypothetical protein